MVLEGAGTIFADAATRSKVQGLCESRLRQLFPGIQTTDGARRAQSVGVDGIGFLPGERSSLVPLFCLGVSAAVAGGFAFWLAKRSR